MPDLLEGENAPQEASLDSQAALGKHVPQAAPGGPRPPAHSASPPAGGLSVSPAVHLPSEQFCSQDPSGRVNHAFGYSQSRATVTTKLRALSPPPKAVLPPSAVTSHPPNTSLRESLSSLHFNGFSCSGHFHINGILQSVAFHD